MSLPTRRAVAAALAAQAGVLGPARAAPGRPARVVSLNPCLDVILVQVADRDRIMALSHYSRDPSGSSMADLARTYPVVHGTAEEVVALSPDLVLAGRPAPANTLAALRRLGVRAELFPVPSTVAESLGQVRRVAELVGRPERGRALAARIEAAVAASAPPPGERRLSALVFQSNGFASAPGTLVDEMMRRAGFDNAAARYGLKMSGEVPLERLLADPPDVLLAGVAQAGQPSWADRIASHPALRSAGRRMYRAAFPRRLMNCGGPVLIDAAGVLAEARRTALRRLA